MTRKTYFTISEIAKEFKVKKSQIRSYEKKGMISPGNDKLGRRSYNQFDLARLELIFHFEHIDYSPDQISELIGILDVNLNKMEQLGKSLEYGEKKFHELEKQSKKIKFPDRISIINEMNMMSNYIEVLKDIKDLNSATKKKPKQKHFRMIPVHVGLSIVILFIAGYFFYQRGTMLNWAQKKPSEAEASSVYRYPVPSEDTGNQQNVSPQPSETTDSQAQIQRDSLIEKSKELFHKEPVIDKTETVILSETALGTTVEKGLLPSTESKDAIIDFELSEVSPEQKDLNVLKESAPLKESDSEKAWEEANLTQHGDAYPALKSGQSVTLTKPVVPPKAGGRQLESKKLVDKTRSSIGETASTETENIAIKHKPLDSNAPQSSPVSVAPDENKQTDYKLSSSSDVKKTKLNTDQNNPNDQNYMVSLFYTSDENREIVDELARLLKTEGFDILGIKKVNYQYRDIRYFHDEDKPGALVLQKISNKSFSRLMKVQDINIKIKNLSNEYPNARKGVLELWINI